MGIELPAELADVAAKAGVQWPQADEDAMRTSATAWRDAGEKIGRLGTSTDGSAGRAMDAMTGATGDAARSHWSKIVAPDGQFQQAARGCNSAADRLEHAAKQVGAAKVEIVRELVTLAKNQDAAGQAASAGHPTALLGLDTAVRGASANVAHLSNTLSSAIRLDSGVQMGQAHAPVNTSPGAHGPGGLLSPVADVVGGVAAPVAQVVVPVAETVGAVAAPVTQTVGAVAAPVVAPVTETVGAVAAPVTQTVGAVAAPVVQPVADAVAPVMDTVRPVADAVPGAQPVLDAVPGRQDGAPGRPDVPPGHGGTPPGLVPEIVDRLGNAAQPAVGTVEQVGRLSGDLLTPHAEGATQASAATLLDRPTLPTEHLTQQPQAPAAAQPQTQAPAMGNAPAAAPSVGAPAAAAQVGGVVGQAQGAAAQQTGAPQPGAQQKPGAPAPGAQTPGAQAPQAAAQAKADAQAKIDQAKSDPAKLDHAKSDPAKPDAQAKPEQAKPDQAKPDQAKPDQAKPDQTGSQPKTDPAKPTPANTVVTQDASGVLPTMLPGGSTAAIDIDHSTAAALANPTVQHVQAASALGTWFMAFLYPMGQTPRPSTKPVRQLPPPDAEVDLAAGLRFAPQDHPKSHLVDTEFAQTPTQTTGLGQEHPTVQALLENYDPLGGAHEHEWERRFLVREEPVEYAWPPAELFPEGGYEEGRPDVLEEGTELDRFGTSEGRVLSQAGTPFAQRSLPPHALHEGYHRYKTLRPLPVWRTVSAPWFGQLGGGARYRTTYPVADLVALGYLMEITS